MAHERKASFGEFRVGLERPLLRRNSPPNPSVCGFGPFAADFSAFCLQWAGHGANFLHVPVEGVDEIVGHQPIEHELAPALTLGAYGWGLFVTTPLVVGMTTGYVANRRVLRSNASTAKYVMLAGALGGMALLMLALEGLMCILLIAPLGLLASFTGGWVGRAMARVGHHRGTPLMSVAVLPMIFALEAAMPPAIPIDTRQSVDIGAPPALFGESSPATKQ